MADKLSIWLKEEQSHWLFFGFAAIVLLSLFAGIATELYFLAGLPAFLLLVYMSLVDFRKVFFLLLICIPFSTEVSLPNGFATDLPTEPLMVGLMLIYLIYIIRHGRQMSGAFLRHPISLLVVLHWLWILATTISSELFLVSLKFSLAKSWYLIVFYFMAGSMLKTEKDVKFFFWSILIPLVITVSIVLAKHAPSGFAFERVKSVLDPFYRNHVNYASILALFVPLVWYAYRWYERWSVPRLVILGSLLILLIGIQFSYTRAAYVSLGLAVGAYFVIRYRLIKAALGLVTIGAIVAVVWLANNNNYLNYAPNYERTVSHTNFDNLVSATYKGEDISTMERFYRWVAGFYMSQAKPLTGFGPGNFYNFYKIYTVSSFQTYVSDNPEKSGIHSYYLMTLVEQGYPGLGIFVLLCFFTLIKGEQIYHATHPPQRRQLIMGILLSLIVIDAILLINDMIETDKVGPFFFIQMAVLVNMDLLNRHQSQQRRVQPPN